MARPRSSMPSAAEILTLVDMRGCLEVRVTPGASADAVVLPPARGPLAVRTTALPEDGKANEAVLRLLAKALGRPASALELVRGITSRNKLVRLVP